MCHKILNFDLNILENIVQNDGFMNLTHNTLVANVKEITMANKKFWLGMLVMVLVLGLTVFGCKEPDVDTWTNVTSLSQLNGTWKGTWNGSFSQTETIEYLTVKTDVEEIIMAINASTSTMSLSTKVTATYSGDGIGDLWSTMKELMEEMIDADVIFDDSNYSVSMTQTISGQPITLSDLGGIQINKNGKEVKYPAGGYFWENSPEIIFVKQ